MIKSVQHIPMGVSAGKTSLGCDIGRAMMVPRGDLFPALAPESSNWVDNFL